jgi:hypothetical protein
MDFEENYNQHRENSTGKIYPELVINDAEEFKAGIRLNSMIRNAVDKYEKETDPMRKAEFAIELDRMRISKMRGTFCENETQRNAIIKDIEAAYERIRTNKKLLKQ